MLKKKFFLVPAVLAIVIVPLILAGCANANTAKNEDGWYDKSSFYYEKDSSYNANFDLWLNVGNEGNYTITTVYLKVSFYGASNNFLATRLTSIRTEITKGHTKKVQTRFTNASNASRAELNSVEYEYTIPEPVTPGDAALPIDILLLMIPFVLLYGGMAVAAVVLGVMAAVRIEKIGGSGVLFFFFGWIYIACSAKSKEWANFNRTLALLLGLFSYIGLPLYVLFTIKNPVRSISLQIQQSGE